MNGLRLIRAFCVLTLLLCTQTGCQGLGNKWFQMDSNSRSPFFGLEFYTKKDKQATPLQNVSQQQPVELERFCKRKQKNHDVFPDFPSG